MLMKDKNRFRSLKLAVPAACLGLLLAASAATATTYSDRGAAIVVWPKIVVDEEAGVDTLLQLSNASRTARVAAHCFYVNANYHCSNTGDVCVPGDAAACVDGGFTGACVPGWIEISTRFLPPKAPDRASLLLSLLTTLDCVPSPPSRGDRKSVV